MSAETRLILEDGSVFEGNGFGHHGAAAGEVVFNTGMVGYPETLTDPSYRGQILVLTYPLIGNYGVPSMRLDNFGLSAGFESSRIQIAGLVVSEHSARFSHHSASISLAHWLAENNIPGVSGIDTRALTKRIREQGSMLGKIETAEEQTEFFNPNLTDLAATVTVGEVIQHETNGCEPKSSAPSVVLLDCAACSLIDGGIRLLLAVRDHGFSRGGASSACPCLIGLTDTVCRHLSDKL